jgi:hypothetical protein
MKLDSNPFHSTLDFINQFVGEFNRMINWSTFFFLFRKWLFCIFLLFLFLRKQILLFWTKAIIFFIWFNLFRGKRWSRMNLYLSNTSFLIFWRVINYMIILFMLSIVIIWWPWINFLKSWSRFTAIILWISSYYWLLIFKIIAAVILFWRELERLVFICFILILLDWGSNLLNLSRL